MKNLCRWVVVLALQGLMVWGVHAASTPYAYTFGGDQNLVAIDISLGAVVKTVPLSSLASIDNGPNTSELDPWRLAVGPDSQTLYVAFAVGLWMIGPVGGGMMLLVDLPTMTPIKWFPISEFSSPGPFTVSPDGTKLFVSNGSIEIFSLPNGDRLGEIEFDSYVSALAISPGGHRLYASTNDGLYNVDIDSHEILGFVSLGNDFPPNAIGMRDLAVTADGSTVYVLAQGYPDSKPGALTSISTRDWQANWTLNFPGSLASIAVNRAGDTAYIAYVDPPPAAVPGIAIAVVDTQERKITATIPLGLIDGYIALTPDERQIYVKSRGELVDKMSIVSTATHTVTKTLTGFSGTYGKNFIASNSDSLPVAREFYHANFDHYFLTNSAIEIDALNAGAFEGWAPTGQTVSVFPQAAGSNSVPVCRYFSAAFAPKSSHFYGLRGGDCEAVPNFFGWEYEGDVFFAARPDASGQCPAGAMPLYRVYNDGMGGAPAHRFTTSLATHQTMIAAGWIPEGPGAGVGMCVPE
jgi:DNA-binding beta-propeller fold protein YncE